MALEASYRDMAYDLGYRDGKNGRRNDPDSVTQDWWGSGTEEERSEAKSQYQSGYAKGERERRQAG